MPETATRFATRDRLWRVALALLPALALVLLRGVDTNWDLRNYHLYNPHGWLTGRLFTDVAPAQQQSWHNPLLDVPLYLLVQSGWDLRWSSAWLVLPWATAIFLLLGLQSRLSPRPPARAEQVVLALLAMSGATTWATLGNSMNDGFVAAAVLGSLSLLLHDPAATPRRWLLAGLLAGAVMGLKLTAVVYCLALAAMAVVPGAPGRGPAIAARLASLAAGGLLGFLATYGWWGWTLYQHFGNPFFPYFNDIFASPWAASRDFVDARFRADGLLDAISVPVQLLWNDTARSELYLRDPRLLFGALGLPWLAWWSHWRGWSTAVPARRLAVFFWAALLAWALQYGIYRYAALLELLGALVLVVGIAHLPRWRVTALMLALVLVSKATHRPDWGHVRNATPRYGLHGLLLPEDALVVTTSGDPLAYVALGLPASVGMVGLDNNFISPSGCGGLERKARATVAAHRGSLWRVGEQSVERGERLGGTGLAATGAPCLRYANTLGTAWLCPVEPTAITRRADCPP